MTKNTRVRVYIYVYKTEIRFTVQQKLIQHCKSTVIPINLKKNESRKFQKSKPKKGRKFELHATTCMNLEDIMPSEMRRSQKEQIPSDSTHMRI